VVRRWALAWWRILYLGAVVCVLVLSPSSYGKVTRRALARHLYLDTAPVLLGFTALAALISLVLTRIVVVTALSYGLSRYALEMVIRVLVLELIPDGGAVRGHALHHSTARSWRCCASLATWPA
jgi:phospholipid/cholesterol/gamma-HCH transport system permease protein